MLILLVEQLVDFGLFYFGPTRNKCDMNILAYVFGYT